MQISKRLMSLLLCIMLLLPFTASCQKSTQSKSFFAMDTVITVTLYQTDRTTAEELFASCQTLLNELDALWSRTSQSGEIARLSKNGVLENPDERTVAVLKTALDVQNKSQGSYSVAVAPLVDLWKSAAEKNLLPTAQELADACDQVNTSAWSVEQTQITFSGGGIDLGSIGKGAAATLLRNLLQNAGISGGFVSFGSNVAPFGVKPDGKEFKVAITNPIDTKTTIGTLNLSSGEVLSVSGDYERFYTIEGGKYHHILNLSTGMPAESGLHSVAVIAEDGALADALSTALFVMGEERAMELYESGTYQFEAVFCRTDGEVVITKGIESRFISNK